MPARAHGSATDGNPRRGTRGQANADALLAAAHRLVLEQGDSFTTQDLIKEAGVALQTFYRHYGGKDQILLAVFGDLIAAHCAALAARGAELDDPVERLHFYVTDTLGQSSGPGGARFVTSNHWRLQQEFPEELADATRPFADLVHHELERAQERGQLSPHAPELDAWLINKLVMAVFHHYAFAAEPPDDHVVDGIWSFCLAAVGGASGARPRSGTPT